MDTKWEKQIMPEVDKTSSGGPPSHLHDRHPLPVPCPVMDGTPSPKRLPLSHLCTGNLIMLACIPQRYFLFPRSLSDILDMDSM